MSVLVSKVWAYFDKTSWFFFLLGWSIIGGVMVVFGSFSSAGYGLGHWAFFLAGLMLIVIAFERRDEGKTSAYAVINAIPVPLLFTAYAYLSSNGYLSAVPFVFQVILFGAIVLVSYYSVRRLTKPLKRRSDSLGGY